MNFRKCKISVKRNKDNIVGYKQEKNPWQND